MSDIDFASGRWTPHRKAAVLKAIRAGELSVSEAMSRWELTLEELQAWGRDYQRWGLRGLKTTRTGDFRAGQPDMAQHGGRRPGSGRPKGSGGTAL